jgi:four helix bundle protein
LISKGKIRTKEVVKILNLFSSHSQERKEFIMSKQLMRSGTNPGAMVREARNAESGKDFIHKFGIAQKETGESMYWLELLKATNYINQEEFDSIYNDAEEILKILTSSLKTKNKKEKSKLMVGF